MLNDEDLALDLWEKHCGPDEQKGNTIHRCMAKREQGEAMIIEAADRVRRGAVAAAVRALGEYRDIFEEVITKAIMNSKSAGEELCNTKD